MERCLRYTLSMCLVVCVCVCVCCCPRTFAYLPEFRIYNYVLKIIWNFLTGTAKSNRSEFYIKKDFRAVEMAQSGKYLRLKHKDRSANPAPT